LLDDEHRCDLADQAAARWGRDGAVFLRSSASHVFLTGDVVLRMAPVGSPQAVAVTRSASMAAILASAGAPVPVPVPSEAGALVEEVDGMVVTALPRVPGATYDGEDLTPQLARLWGRTLGRFHETGYIHGDPEPDNLVVDGDTATFVDLDDAGPGDAIADLAFALRAWSPPGGPRDRTDPVVVAFLSAYRGARALNDVDLDRLDAAARAVARRTLASYQVHLGTPPDADWPDWALRLHATIASRATELEAGLKAR
jgi:Ser/Thr protein kinase RdoA (MazF antagonist)